VATVTLALVMIATVMVAPAVERQHWAWAVLTLAPVPLWRVVLA